MLTYNIAVLGAAMIAGLSAAAPAGTGSVASNKGQHQKTLIVFGDSLSDIGSGWKRVNFDPNYKPPPWFQGRYSSGFVWNEWTADELNYTLANFAYGGATSNNSFVKSDVPSVADQIDMYSKQKAADRYASPEDDVVAIEIGSNDVMKDVKKLAFADKDGIEKFARNLTSDIISSVDRMVQFGYKSFLVFNLPPIHITPIVISLKLTSYVAPIVQTINDIYTDAVEQYKNSHSGLNITIVDTSYLASTIIGSLLPDLNIKYADKSCVTTDLKNQTKHCTNPDEFFFMDAIHPTRLPHRLIGYVVAKIIQDNSYNATVEDMRSLIKTRGIRNAYEPVKVTEYQANGDYADINSEIKDQATRSASKGEEINNGIATPYSLADSSGGDEKSSGNSDSDIASHASASHSKNLAGSATRLSAAAAAAALFASLFI
ncbi:hypothetical protein GGI12_002212 [Dipsacomyces acuminosporus]|nr:hypothetical protein GGI12_002212 [Dipsacomyces acuminosporus]